MGDRIIVARILQHPRSSPTNPKGKLDTDPHWWMPMTLPRDGYIALMAKKGVSKTQVWATFVPEWALPVHIIASFVRAQWISWSHE